MNTNINKLMTAAGIIAAAIFLNGCRTAAEYRKEADETAYNIVEDTRRAVLDKNQTAFNIEPPSITLRRRLIAMQDLPAYSSATLGLDELEKPQHWPEHISNTHSATNDAGVLLTNDGTIELSLLDALAIAARNSTSPVAPPRPQTHQRISPESHE